MENMIRIFENEEFGTVRTVNEDNGRTLVCGKGCGFCIGLQQHKGRNTD